MKKSLFTLMVGAALALVIGCNDGKVRALETQLKETNDKLAALQQKVDMLNLELSDMKGKVENKGAEGAAAAAPAEGAAQPAAAPAEGAAPAPAPEGGQ